jgi:hypothetical protein
MPSDAVLIAIITAAAGLIGGLVGALASPIGKDWVAKREFDRHRQLTATEKERDAQDASLKARREAIQSVIDGIAEAMQHYDAEWRGIANYHAKTDALKAANRAWAEAQQLADPASRNLVSAWKRAIDTADMEYRSGSEPPSYSDLYALYVTAIGALTDALPTHQT